jgi:hypothetical protein
MVTRQASETVGEIRWQPAHCVALVALALLQPTLDVLARNPPFLAGHGSDTALLFAVLLLICGLLPAAFWGLCRLLSCFSWWRFLGPVLVFALFVLLARGFLPNDWQLTPKRQIVGCLGGAALLWAIHRFSEVFRTALAWLAFSPLVFAGYFLADPHVRPFWYPAERAVIPEVPAGTSIAVLLLDELPLLSLVDRQGKIDRHYYPHFAAVADTSTHYEKATSVAAYTEVAVPALLTGVYPREPNVVYTHDHSRLPSIFEAFQRDQLQVREIFTYLCPRSRCPRPEASSPLVPRVEAFLADLSLIFLHAITLPVARHRLPPIATRWKGFWAQESLTGDDDPAQDLRDFLGRLEKRPGSRLIFYHAMLPHTPLQYLPNGDRYEHNLLVPVDDGTLDASPGGVEDPWDSLQLYQRHLLQVQATDHLVGEWRRRLEELDLWDESWVIVTADHGIAFRAGRHYRGNAQVATLRSAILPIPLLIKAPGQTEPEVEPRPIELVDIFPTLFARLGSSLPWPHDGRPLGSAPDAATDLQSAPRVARLHGFDAADWRTGDTAFAEALQRKFEIPGLNSGAGSFFALSPRPDLLGTPSPSGASTSTAYLWSRQPDLAYQPAAALKPLLVLGELESGEGEPPPERGSVVTIAIDGVVRAVAPVRREPRLSSHIRPWRDAEARRGVRFEHFFSAVIDPAYLRKNRSALDLALVESTAQGDRRRRLRVEALFSPAAPIFADGFESGDTSGWSRP